MDERIRKTLRHVISRLGIKHKSARQCQLPLCRNVISLLRLRGEGQAGGGGACPALQVTAGSRKVQSVHRAIRRG